MSEAWDITQSTRHFVTGGCGFIGSHLVDHLQSKGHVVTVYDNLSSGTKKWIERNLESDNVSLIEADLLNLDSLRQAMAGHDLVWHLGANTDIPGGTSQVDLDLKNCTVATHNVLEAMRATDIRRVIFSSSATVYGDVPLQLLPETFGPLLPISLYGAAKLACEALISSYCHLFGLEARIFRFANVVGARMGHGVIFDFIRKLERSSSELEILGDGRQEKSFFLVEDCIQGMLWAAHKCQADYDVFNLGSDTSTTVDRIAQIVIDQMGLGKVQFRYTGGSRGWPGDVPKAVLDVKKMRELGWNSAHASDEAVETATRRLLGKE